MYFSSTQETSRSRYPGLQNNSSSNLCFLNSVIQALASITELHHYLKKINVSLQDGAKGDNSSSSSIISSLVEMIEELNLPRERRVILRPTKIIETIISNNVNSTRLFDSSQQDAHELLIIIIESIELEVNRVTTLHPSSKPLGLSELLLPNQPNHLKSSRLYNLSSPSTSSFPRIPFRGLMANRIACASCGFSAGIRHSPTDILSINLPATASCTIEGCLEEYTMLEILDQYVCRKCTLLNAEKMMKIELSARIKSKVKRAEVKSNLVKISDAIKHNPELEFDPSLEHSLLPIPSRMTTKQTMFARPPNVLTFHVARTTLIGHGQLTKNYCRLEFPEILILDPFTTTQTLCTRAEAPISGGLTKRDAPARTSVRYPYQLLAVIVHQGNHSSGHYLTFRRAPSSGTWWRFSDHDVDRCQVNEVLDSNPTLLIYQLLGLENHPNVSEA